MKNVGLWLVLVVVLLARPARADDPKSSVADSYKKITQAVSAGDADGMVALMADDYVAVDTKGNAKTHEASIQDIRDIIGHRKEGTMTFSITNVKKIDDTTLEVSVNVHSDLTVDIDGAAHKIVSDEVCTDTWTLGGDGPRLRKSVTVREDGTVDGKPIPKNP